jgi:hypothetical protein
MQVSDRLTVRDQLTFATALAAVAFVLNWLWEMAQMPAYTELAGRRWSDTLVPCTVATAGDVGLTFVVYGVGALAAGRLSWGEAKKWNVYAAAAILGALIAIAIEWRAARTGRWSYTEDMPIVPGLGVGLWPLLQLVVLTPLSIWIAWWLGKRTARHRHGASAPRS